MEVTLLLIRVLWNLHHLVVVLPEEAGLPLAVEGAALLTVRILLAGVDPEIAVVVLALETATAVAVHWAFVVAVPETAVGFFVVAVPVLDFEIVAAVVSVVAPLFVAIPVSVYFLPEFWQRLLPWQQVCPRQAT